jgi:hypothetical protein
MVLIHRSGFARSPILGRLGGALVALGLSGLFPATRLLPVRRKAEALCEPVPAPNALQESREPHLILTNLR